MPDEKNPMPGSRAAPEPATGGRARRQRRLRLAAGGLAVAVLLVAGIAAVIALRGGVGGPAVTVVGGSQGNELHSFNADHHAPFISIADYYPHYADHDPNYVLVDVREAGERAAAKIPDDIWVPLADMATSGWQYLQQYKAKTIVLYCDCPWAEAATASSILEAYGFSDDHLRVLHEGIPGWQQVGYPIVPGGNVCAGQTWPQACGGS